MFNLICFYVKNSLRVNEIAPYYNKVKKNIKIHSQQDLHRVTPLPKHEYITLYSSYSKRCIVS